MANDHLRQMVKSETAQILAFHQEVWVKLRDQVADELAPLLADLVRQELMQQLAEPRPDERLDAMQQAVTNLTTWWHESNEGRETWDDLPCCLYGELVKAAQALPAELPPRLVVHTATLRQLVPLMDAVRLALQTFEGLQRNPLILEAELVYPIEQLRKALGEVPNG